MAHEIQRTTVSPAELFEAAESAVRSGRRQTAQLHGNMVAIIPQKSPAGARMTSRQKTHRENGFLAAYGSVPPLSPPRTDTEMTEIAAEEAAQKAARGGQPPHAGA
jgi:hypothetical protein